jgi:hypothetical protein
MLQIECDVREGCILRLSAEIGGVVSAFLAALTLLGCGGANGGNPQVSPSTAAFTVDAAWTANSDNPDGYLVYAGSSPGDATTLVKTLSKGTANWNPMSPAVQLTSSDLAGAIGESAQVCVRVRAYNAGGVSVASEATCAALP